MLIYLQVSICRDSQVDEGVMRKCGEEVVEHANSCLDVGPSRSIEIEVDDDPGLIRDPLDMCCSFQGNGHQEAPSRMATELA